MSSAETRPGPYRVMTVCTGNICRSPMAEVVLRDRFEAAGLGDRVVAIHLKDGPVTKDTAAQLPAGQGDVGIWRILAAAKNLEVGVVEFDDYAGDIFEGVAASLTYLEAGAPTGEEAAR